VKLVVAAVGSPGHADLASAIADYENRTRHYFDLEVVEIPAAAGSLPPARRQEIEAASLRERVPVGLELFALTRRGKGLGSRALARYLGDQAVHGAAGVAFVVGGTFGLAPSYLEEADHLLALSPMTMPHGLARLVLTEQLYRAGTILRGEPYHKGG
jgi:23S rRNA (pseudouridine1915-N3)-methyltransferase